MIITISQNKLTSQQYFWWYIPSFERFSNIFLTFLYTGPISYIDITYIDISYLSSSILTYFYNLLQFQYDFYNELYRSTMMIKFFPLGIELHFNYCPTLLPDYSLSQAFMQLLHKQYKPLVQRHNLKLLEEKSQMKITKNVAVMFLQVNRIKGRVKNVANAIYLFVLTMKK